MSNKEPLKILEQGRTESELLLTQQTGLKGGGLEARRLRTELRSQGEGAQTDRESWKTERGMGMGGTIQEGEPSQMASLVSRRQGTPTGFKLGSLERVPSQMPAVPAKK